MRALVETMADTHIVVVAAAGRVDLRGQPSELELVGIGEDIPIGCRSGLHAKVDSALPLVAAAFAKGVGIEILVGLAVVAVHDGEVEVASRLDSQADQSCKAKGR